MVDNNISLTVPMTYTALSSAADMLYKLAQDELHSLPEIEDAPLSEPKKILTEADLAEAPRPDNPSPEVTEPNPAVFTDQPGVDKEVILDANNLPWDVRIHSKAQSFNADGTWKYLRGVDRETLVPQVEAELKAKYAQADTPPAPPAPPVAAESDITTFAGLVEGINSKGITSDQVNAALETADVPSMIMLARTPDKVPTVAGLLGL